MCLLEITNQNGVRIANEFSRGTSAELIYDLPEGWV